MIASLPARYATKAVLTIAAKTAMRGTLYAVKRAVPHLIVHKVASTIVAAAKKRKRVDIDVKHSEEPRHIEAYNSIINYDVISICETSLNDSVELPETLLNEYTFLPANNPANTRHGGVGLFYKNSFTGIVKNDLTFNESIVVELKFGRKKVFFTVLYRSSAFYHNSRNLYAKIKAGISITVFFTGDFNARFQFHHHIIYCKANFITPPPSPFERKIWHFNRANSTAINRSMTNFPWLQYLNLNTDPNWQVKTFTEIFLGIMSKCIPIETKKFIPRDPPWITKPLKTLTNKKNRQFKNYNNNGYKYKYKYRLGAFRIECQQVVESAKLTYLMTLTLLKMLIGRW